MDREALDRCVQSFEAAGPLLEAWQLLDRERGWRNLGHLTASIGRDSLTQLCGPLGRLLPGCPDPDMALNNLERFLAGPGGTERLPVLLEGQARTLDVLLQLLGSSHGFSDLLCQHPDCLHILREPPHVPGKEALRGELQAEVDAAADDTGALSAFRRFRQRQLLRIGLNDIVHERPLEEITSDLSQTADAALEVALATARRTVERRFGQPATAHGEPVRCVVLALGKLGGEELNYSSDIDLIVVYDEEGVTRGAHTASVGNDEFFARVVSELVRLLSQHTGSGQAWRVDLRLRPEGQRGPLARSLASTLAYYDALGRTWERQALIKARPAAGDHELGRRFLEAVESFVYRKYLSFAEIKEIKALKRRIEQKTSKAGVSEREVKTGRGGIRDIEFTIQFLQLLNGGDLKEVHQRNTFQALHALERVGCLTDPEYRVLDDAYRFLRRTEHRLQLLFDLQTHTLPEAPDELTRLALRMGYAWTERAGGPQAAFAADHAEKTELTRRILDHLLHQTFAGDPEEAQPESDLLLDPSPDPETIRVVLGRYGFRDVQGAYQNLNRLAQESVPFLSTRRCRHFLASIAPSLLRALAEAPDPDQALATLERVTGSLGAKTVLWELFSFNPPSLRLCVDLCASSQFLSELLITNPGMIDELLDSLVLNQPRSRQELTVELAALCRGAHELDPILHSFQDTHLLRIGVRHILGKDTIRQTTAALSDLAETILVRVVDAELAMLEMRYGRPVLGEGPRAGEPCRWVLLALGKLGGREMSYHSDLDLVLIYEGEGRTEPPPGLSRFERPEPIDNASFFTELAQHVIRTTSTVGPLGRLYEVDMRLRPTGRSGTLVVPLEEFQRYHRAGGAQLWERQTLTRARAVHGDPVFAGEAEALVRDLVCVVPWSPELAEELGAMRQRLEASRSRRNLKRGVGGLVDIEFLAQLFQIKYGRAHPELLTPDLWEALATLERLRLIGAADAFALGQAHDFLLRVQGRLRIVHNRSLDEVPDEPDEVEKLARRLGVESGTRLLGELNAHLAENRAIFLRLLEKERTSPGPT
jgi:glutamate-ammonia-ligase adenylyltransferase